MRITNNAVSSTHNVLVITPVQVYNGHTRVYVDMYCLINHGTTANVCSWHLGSDLNLGIGKKVYNSDIILANSNHITMSVYDIEMGIKGIVETVIHHLNHVVVLPEVNFLELHLTSNDLIK